MTPHAQAARSTKMTKPGPKPKALVARVLARTEIDPATGCRNWMAPLTAGGYGRLGGRGYAVFAHRVMYEAAKGPIPPGLQIDHLCRNKRCCNPDHQEAVTPRENTLRSSAPSAQRSRQTHCVHGHPLDAENTRLSARGQRQCRACQKRHAKNYNDRMRGHWGTRQAGLNNGDLL